MTALKKSHSNLLRFRLVGIFILLTFSCVRFDDLKSPVDGLKVMIDYNIFNTFLSFRFVDAATGNLIGAKDDEKVRVNITGNSSGAVVDQMGNHETYYDAVFGLLSLALNPKDPWKPSAGNILSVQIEATNHLYKPVDLKLQIDSTGKYEYRVIMEKKDVDALGVKTYSFQLNLDKNGELENDFNFTSTAGEVMLNMKKGTQFQKANGDVEYISPVNLVLKVYTKLSAVPLPSSLLADVIFTDLTKRKTALDLYRVVDVQLKNSTSEELTAPVKHPVVMRYKIDKTAYHPQTKKPVSSGDEINTYSYLPKSLAWQFGEKQSLQSDSLGFYVISEVKRFALYSTGMHIDLCSMYGDFSVNLQGTFPQYPVSASVYYYRKIDSRYIGNMKIDIPEAGFQQALSFNVPENTPVRTNIWNYSNSNSFIAKPNVFIHEAGCGSFGKFETIVTTTSVNVSGKVKVQLLDDFPEEEFYVNAQIYNSVTNGLIWSKQYKISKTINELEINAALPAGTQVYVKLQAVKSENSFESIPASIDFNTSSGQGLVWEYIISPLFSLVNLNFNFTQSSEFPANSYKVKAEFSNFDNNSKEGSVIFQVKPGQTKYSAQVYLSKKKRYTLNLKRVEGETAFIAYPYEFNIGYISQPDYSFDSELSKVTLKDVTITAQVVCPKSEIIPSLHGYYRTVWEDEWKEGDIVKGVLKIKSETNATYIIGLIVNGTMETTTYKIDETNFKLEFKLSDWDCDQMGW